MASFSPSKYSSGSSLKPTLGSISYKICHKNIYIFCMLPRVIYKEQHSKILGFHGGDYEE
jgi:hypothetical protein